MIGNFSLHLSYWKNQKISLSKVPTKTNHLSLTYKLKKLYYRVLVIEKTLSEKNNYTSL